MARTLKFDDTKRRKLIEHLNNGMTRGEAAKQCGVSRETVRLHMRGDNGFATEVSEAEMNANEAVEEALYQAALSGNVTACLAWLYSRMSDRWQDRRFGKGGPEAQPQAKAG